jgi:hypothetical protein
MSTYEISLALPGATFTPVYWEYGDAPEPTAVMGDPLNVLAEGFELFALYVDPRNYYLLTSVTDIWGNVSTEADAVTLTEALGP